LSRFVGWDCASLLRIALFDKHLVVEERRQRAAQKITEFLKGSGRFSKTIVFCVDIELAEGMRTELANASADLVAA